MNRFLTIGCASVAGLCCVGSGVLFAIGARATGAVQDASHACDGVPVPEAAGAASTPTRVLAFTRGRSRWSYAGTELPTSHTDATTVAEASLVFCFEEEEQHEIEACPYDSGIVLHRMVRTRRVRAVDPRTAAVLREAPLSGAMPDACPGSVGSVTAYGVRLGSSDRESIGPAPGHADIVAQFGDLVR